MKIEEAIKIKSDPKFGTRLPVPKSEIEADSMSIEALKREKESRGDLRPGLYPLLPGETKE